MSASSHPSIIRAKQGQRETQLMGSSLSSLSSTLSSSSSPSTSSLPDFALLRPALSSSLINGQALPNTADQVTGESSDGQNSKDAEGFALRVSRSFSPRASVLDCSGNSRTTGGERSRIIAQSSSDWSSSGILRSCSMHSKLDLLRIVERDC